MNYCFVLAWAFFSGIGTEDMITPDDADVFRNIMLVVVGVGFSASMGYQMLTTIPNNQNNERIEEITTLQPTGSM